MIKNPVHSALIIQDIQANANPGTDTDSEVVAPLTQIPGMTPLIGGNIGAVIGRNSEPGAAVGEKSAEYAG